MQKKYFYMSIGYPIGLCEIETVERVFNVELNGNFIGLPLAEYNIWKYCFFDVKNMESIEKQFGPKLDNYINDLMDNKLLVRLDLNDTEDTYNKLRLLTPLRNGFGVGINKDDKYEVLNQKTPFILNPDQFRYWAEASNRIMNKDIFDKLFNHFDEKTKKIYCINIVLALKTLDLIRLNKRERVS